MGGSAAGRGWERAEKREGGGGQYRYCHDWTGGLEVTRTRSNPARAVFIRRPSPYTACLRCLLESARTEELPHEPAARSPTPVCHHLSRPRHCDRCWVPRPLPSAGSSAPLAAAATRRRHAGVRCPSVLLPGGRCRPSAHLGSSLVFTGSPGVDCCHPPASPRRPLLSGGTTACYCIFSLSHLAADTATRHGTAGCLSHPQLRWLSAPRSPSPPLGWLFS